MKRIFVLPFALAAAAFPACGSLDPNTGSPRPLASVRGDLANPDSLSLTGAVRVAVVWRVERNGYDQFSVAEDLPVQPVFPSSFTIDLDGPPPEAAMNSAASSGSTTQPGATTTAGGGGMAGAPGVDDGGSAPMTSVSGQSLRTLNMQLVPNPNLEYAIGTVVAYEDQNRNGKLDLVPADASAYIDRIVATNTEVAIFYFQGPLTDSSGAPLPIADSAGHRPTDGYNLARVPRCDRPMGNSPGGVASNPACTAPPPVVDAGTCQSMSWLPIDAPFDLTVADSPEVATLMCEYGLSTASASSGSGGPPNDVSVQPARYPDPCDPNLLCASDGSSYSYATCMQVSQGICQGTVTSCTGAGYLRPTPVPADWPCIH